MPPRNNIFSRGKDWTIAAAVGLLAVVSFVPSAADYTYPGETARIVSGWLGLGVMPYNEFPLMALFARPLGCSNALAVISGAVAAIALFHLLSVFLYGRIGGEYSRQDAYALSRIGGFTAAAVFLFSPAVINSGTHLEPRLFDAAWALCAFALAIPFTRLPRKAAWLLPIAMGAMVGMGVADTVEFLFLLPLYICVAWRVSKRRGGKGYGSAALFLAAFFSLVFFWSLGAVGDFGEYWTAQKALTRVWNHAKGSLLVVLFTIGPFIVSLFSSAKAFRLENGRVNWIFHALVTVLSILSIATSMSASSILMPTGIPPVLACAAAAFTAGYVLAFWMGQIRAAIRLNESVKSSAAIKAIAAKQRLAGLVGGGVFAAVIVVSSLINRFAVADADCGRFADEIADMIVDEMGDRTWLVTDGVLDDHILIAAKRAGKDIHLVSLTREKDAGYIDSLASAVESAGLGGTKCMELVDILRRHRGLDKMRLVPFIQKWFSSDPDIAKKVAVFGAPDLWFYANTEPVPELLFYGGDAAKTADWSKWKELSAILHAPKGWGSYSLYALDETGAQPAMIDALDRRRLNLRRHAGFMATNRGYMYHERARKLQDENAGKEEYEPLYDKAFEMYELVLNEIDPDNVCALINEFELASAGYPKARAKLKSLNAALAKIKENERRRYTPDELSLLYGYICNPELMFKRGLSLLLKAGRPGDGMNNLRRALEFVAAEDRAAIELRVLAAFYAQGGMKDKAKARSIYDQALRTDATNREALAGLARLEMMEGNNAKAIEYLERATEGGGNDPANLLNRATLSLLKSQYPEAKALLRQITDADPSNIGAWTLLASTVFRQIDDLGDVGDNAELQKAKRALEEEIENEILPAMERQSAGQADYRVQSAKAYALMRKGGEENIRSARDAFATAASIRPDIAATSDIIIGLDIQLNDHEDAERRAIEKLDSNEEDPMANYVMGSIALGRNDLAAAEKHLRLAVRGPRPNVLALNDLAELLRRTKNYDEAEKFARTATEVAPKLYVVWETLGSILMDAGKSFDEAEACVQKACDLSKDADGKMADIRMLISLARVQIKRGELLKGKMTLRSVSGRLGELTEFEKKEFEELRKSVR